VPTHYEALGIAPDADSEAIRQAYLAVAKANHPDRRQVGDERRRAAADARIRAANAAWHVLRDPDRRAAYDEGLARGREGGAGSTATVPAQGPVGSSRPRPGVVGARPAPPSGAAVPAAHASWWRYAPAVVLLVVLALVLVVTAYATSGGSGQTEPVAPEVVPEVGDCVLVVVVGGRLAPARVGCGTEGAEPVAAVVDTPRPCPTGTEAVAMPDRRTTLCLGMPT
jgi:hypothetical protein